MLLFLPPLLEEMNRTRALLVATMRALADRGWSCLLPGRSGTGESERPLEACSWADWRAAVGAVAPPSLAGTVAVRGGCLLDDAAPASCRWRFSPVDGASLVRDLDRAGLVSKGGAAGYALSTALSTGLAAAIPADHGRLRTLRLAGDPGTAERKVDYAPLWRRAEPQTSSELSRLIALDIDEWMRSCGAS